MNECAMRIARAAQRERSTTIRAVVRLKMLDRAAYNRYRARFFEAVPELQQTAFAPSRARSIEARAAYHGSQP